MFYEKWPLFKSQSQPQTLLNLPSFFRFCLSCATWSLLCCCNWIDLPLSVWILMLWNGPQRLDPLRSSPAAAPPVEEGCFEAVVGMLSKMVWSLWWKCKWPLCMRWSVIEPPPPPPPEPLPDDPVPASSGPELELDSPDRRFLNSKSMPASSRLRRRPWSDEDPDDPWPLDFRVDSVWTFMLGEISSILLGFCSHTGWGARVRKGFAGINREWDREFGWSDTERVGIFGKDFFKFSQFL